MATATVKPAGLTITRAGLKFTVTWKVVDENYDGGVEVQWRSWQGGSTKATQAWTEWTSITIYRGDTSASKSFSAASFFPTTDQYLFGVVFRVRGKRKNEDNKTYDWSAWTDKTMDLYAPGNPTVAQELDGQQENVTIFSWNANASDTNTRPVKDVEWQSILVENCDETDGSKLSWKTTTLGWQTGTGGLESSKTIADESELVLAGYYTRWFRVRARGCGGNDGGLSAWKYAKHIYAIPAVPTINETSCSNSMWCTVNWTAPTNNYRPIDYVEVQWCKGYPDVNMGITQTPSWNTAVTLRDSGGIDEVNFAIGQTLELDECLWVQVVAHHDRRERASAAALVKVAKMTQPEDLEVEIGMDPDDPRVGVSAAYNGNVPIGTGNTPNVKIAVICRRTADGSSVDDIIGLTYISETFRYPAPAAGETLRFGVYAFVGSYTRELNTANNVTYYTIDADMTSDIIWDGGYVPQVATNIKAVTTETPGEVLLTWKWPSWEKANRCEISWSKNPNAWESNKGPETYMLTSLSQARIRISELEVGATWYFRIRIANETDRTITYGPYCDTIEVNLSSAPSIPVLSLSRAVIRKYTDDTKDLVKASWVYASTDKLEQNYARVSLVTYSGDDMIVGNTVVAVDTNARSKTFYARTKNSDGTYTGWPAGTYLMVVRVRNTANKWSEFSDPVSLIVAEPVTCTITSTSLVSKTITDEQGNVITAYDLTALPLTVTATGAGAGGTTQVIIERADEYRMIRPDETTLDGYAGESIAVMRKSGQPTITITANDISGRLDDGAPYRLIVSSTDSYGQSDTKTIDFEVHWTRQAEKPTASVEMEESAAIITVNRPVTAVAGDVCDIYRLTADTPELVVEAGEFGVPYVDPYPAIGEGFGHRCVHRTTNGDYITEDMQPAWVDLSDMDGDILDVDYGIIDFDGRQLLFRYNTELSSTWQKDFQSTRYLGGSIVGDWNPGVVRQTTINAIVTTDEDEDFQNLRRLADYTGICHVRTPEGSSFPADVQVGDSLTFAEAGLLAHVTLTCTRVDAEELDGVPYSVWESEG